MDPIFTGVPTTQKKIFQLRAARDSTNSLKWTWDAGHVIPGSYELTVRQFGKRLRLEVPDVGLRNHQLTIRPRVRVSAQVFDRKTGKPLKDAQVYWTTPLPRGVLGSTPNLVERDEKADAFVLFCSEGGLTLRATAKGYRTFSSGQIAQGPTQNVIMKLVRKQGFSLRFVCGEERVPLDSEQTPTIFDANEKPARWQHIWSSENEGTFEIYLKKVGHYRVHFPSFPGYEPIPDRKVEVQEGKLEALVLDLKRKN